MFDIELSNIARITERVLGHPKKTVDIDGWNEFNCPYCCEEEGVENDGKYNLCVNYREGWHHCWRCNTSGRISKVIRRSIITKLRAYVVLRNINYTKRTLW